MFKEIIWFLGFSIAANGFAVLPTVYCTKGGAETAFTFEEGVDDFYLDVTERAAPETFIGKLLKTTRWVPHTFSARIPKINPKSETEPSCLLSLDEPLLFSCTDGVVGSKAIVVFEEQSYSGVASPPQRLEIDVNSLSVQYRVINKQSIDSNGNMQNTEGLAVVLNVDVKEAKGNRSIDTKFDFEKRHCTYGEHDSPARDF